MVVCGREMSMYSRSTALVYVANNASAVTAAEAMANPLAMAAVVVGTTLGMLAANAPAVWLGERLAQKVNMKVMRWIAAGLFIVLGVLSLVW